MNKNELKFKRLSPVFYVTDFVKNEPLCDYEIYLRELLNKSAYFKNLSNGTEYREPESESNGEYDAISQFYSIDFKLVESTTIIEANSQFSYSISNIGSGVTSFGPSAKSGETIGTVLYVALRTIENFEQIDEIIKTHNKYIKLEQRNEHQIESIINVDLNKYFKLLSKDKNILLYLPYEFYVDGIVDDSEMIIYIRDALFNDYGLSFKYRYEKLSDKDTYICCIYKNGLIIYRYDDNNLFYVDRISLDESSTYNYLNKRYI